MPPCFERTIQKIECLDAKGYFANAADDDALGKIKIEIVEGDFSAEFKKSSAHYILNWSVTRYVY